MSLPSDQTNPTFKISPDWAAQSRGLKQRFSALTDDDLACEPGKENEMLSRIESRLSKDRAAVISFLNSASVPRHTQATAPKRRKK